MVPVLSIFRTKRKFKLPFTMADSSFILSFPFIVLS